MDIIDPSIVLLISSLLASVLSITMAGLAMDFKRRADRLPDATKYDDIFERRVQEQQRLAALRDELSVVEQKIQERDRLIGEVAATQEQLEAIRGELASLDAARREIDEVKREAGEAAGEIARKQEELRQLGEELEQKRAELKEIDRRSGPDQIEAMTAQFKALEAEKIRLESELPALRVERDGALRRIEEAQSLEARKAVLIAKVEELEQLLQGATKNRDQLLEEEQNLRTIRADAVRLTDETDSLRTRRNDLASELQELEGKSSNLEALRLEFDELFTATSFARDRKEEISQEIARLEARRERLAAETHETVGENLLQDLEQSPACLLTPARTASGTKTEVEALETVQKYLREHGLEYSFRTLQAFHTCLKTNDTAQITVLAGVSGTGKSLLPRRYAEAMGIHFLQIAVEPRWDSPQDLLGFYNYIEKKYRATDLSRLLVHMDPFNSVELSSRDKGLSDHVALVLLDEMNLARVEYYFSEFLSRLEARPRFDEQDDRLKRKDAMIPIDIRGLRNNLALYPSLNVLFAGTMNDDESTQALSDKVLDRGNVIQFAAPKDFTTPKAAERTPSPNDALPLTTWRTWVRQTDGLGADLSKAVSVIGKLAEIMEGCGRPFGHRLRDSILSYAANYPKEANGSRDITLPLADQIELRILPKLRGLEIDPHTEQFEQLGALISKDLGDSQMADRLEELWSKQRDGAGLFVWRGLTRPTS